VRYLGTSPVRAEAIRACLEQLQEPQRLLRQLAALLREARRRLQKTKRLLAEPARLRGYRYHGYTRRRKSAPTKQAAASSNPGEGNTDGKLLNRKEYRYGRTK
jgi:hypothetical protein